MNGTSFRPGDPTDTEPERIVALADQFASHWHAGQTDKNGDPYIEHPRRVAARLSQPNHKAVALLHDVLEDTGAERGDLVDAGFPPEVIDAVECLTRREGESLESYLAAVADCDLALAVKRADIEDNCDPDRVARLADPSTRERLASKYQRSLRILDDHAQDPDTPRV